MEIDTQSAKYMVATMGSSDSFVYNCLVLSDGISYKQFIFNPTPQRVNGLSMTYLNDATCLLILSILFALLVFTEL